MSCYFGLYFGNSNMCLAMHKDSKTEVLANAAGYRVTPAVIAFYDESEKVVGLDAKQAMQRNVGNTITHIKNLLESGSEVEVNSKSESQINGKKNSKIDCDRNGIVSRHGVSDFLAILFQNMKEIASSHSHEDEYPTVVSVPLSFTPRQRQIVAKAATDAGFQLLRIITEPAAATLAYNLGQESNDSNGKVLVFRMGGISTDVTILQVSYGMYSVLSTVQKKNFGGNVITNCVVEFCSNEFKRQYKVDLKENKRSVMKLLAAAEHYKHVVYGTTNEKCQVESLYDGIDLNINISKARFESLIHTSVLQCLEPIHSALNSASLSISDINTVILTGGSCKIPKLQQIISSTFPSASVLYSINPDEATAVGAAKQATLTNSVINEENSYVSLLSSDLSIQISGLSEKREDLLLCSKGTLIPTVITQSFLIPNGNIQLLVELYESSNKDDCRTLLAMLKMPNLPAGEVYFSFHIRSDGSVTAVCKDGSSKEIGSATLVPPCTCI